MYAPPSCTPPTVCGAAPGRKGTTYSERWLLLHSMEKRETRAGPSRDLTSGLRRSFFRGGSNGLLSYLGRTLILGRVNPHKVAVDYFHVFFMY